MPSFSKTSREKLDTADLDLQRLFERVVQVIDCTIVEGHRDEERQNRFFDEGKSKVRWPMGKHNSIPSKAVDVCPYLHGSLSWDSRHCLYFAGIVMGIASEMGIKVRWGGDWDMDGEPITDQDFQDLVHFELVSV